MPRPATIRTRYQGDWAVCIQHPGRSEVETLCGLPLAPAGGDQKGDEPTCPDCIKVVNACKRMTGVL